MNVCVEILLSFRRSIRLIFRESQKNGNWEVVVLFTFVPHFENENYFGIFKHRGNMPNCKVKFKKIGEWVGKDTRTHNNKKR